MMSPLRWFVAPLAIYAAMLADVTLRSAIDAEWLPNLVLLIAFVLVRTPGGIVWTAMAGLICDGVTGRPLGTTMLAATLAAALYRELTRVNARGAFGLLAKLAAFIAFVECSASVVTETVSDTSNMAAALANGMQTAIATAAVAALLVTARRLTKRIVSLPSHDVPSRWNIGNI